MSTTADGAISAAFTHRHCPIPGPVRPPLQPIDIDDLIGVGPSMPPPPPTMPQPPFPPIDLGWISDVDQGSMLGGALASRGD